MGNNLLIKETWVNQSEGYQCGDSGLYETRYEQGEEGKLFKFLQKQYGRCVSKLYIDPDAKAIGWVFEKSMRYEDTHEPYIQETWVELHESEPETHITNHYHELN